MAEEHARRQGAGAGSEHAAVLSQAEFLLQVAPRRAPAAPAEPSVLREEALRWVQSRAEVSVLRDLTLTLTLALALTLTLTR